MKLLLVLIAIHFAAPFLFAQAASTSSFHPGLDAWRGSRADVYSNDFAELSRYREANAKLVTPAKGEMRVVFFGDSITDGWHLTHSFPDKPYINRGIGGQTTLQMLGRFRQDVIALQPKVVVILAGTNDVAGNTGPVSNEDIESNFASMAELARVNGIRVVFSSVLAVHDYNPNTHEFFATRPMERIVALNLWMKDYCAANDVTYLDYFTPMLDSTGHLRKELADDGLHPNADGYKLMAPLAEAAIQKAMK